MLRWFSRNNAKTEPLRSQEFEEIIKRLSVLRMDLDAIISKQQQMELKYLSLQGKMYSLISKKEQSEQPKDESKASNSDDVVYL